MGMITSKTYQETANFLPTLLLPPLSPTVSIPQTNPCEKKGKNVRTNRCEESERRRKKERNRPFVGFFEGDKREKEKKKREWSVPCVRKFLPVHFLCGNLSMGRRRENKKGGSVEEKGEAKRKGKGEKEGPHFR